LELVILSLLNGVSFGMVLFLLTVGLSITLGLMGIINLSHGALFMVASFVGWMLVVQLGYSYWLALLVGAIIAGLVGLGIEQGFLSRLHGRTDDQVLLTIGFIYILMNLSLWIWGGRARMPYSAPILSGTFYIAGWQYPIYRMFIIGAGVILIVALWWLLERTRIGAIIRAGMDDIETANALGKNMGRINALVFFLGSFLAGLAGVIGAQMMGPRIGMGWDILLLALVVLVVGGMGSIQGALIGALLIGLVDSFGRALLPDLAMFFMYIVMIIVLLVKPSGLLPRGYES
jgi:branched-chain amino acid transport system permease protein